MPLSAARLLLLPALLLAALAAPGPAPCAPAAPPAGIPPGFENVTVEPGTPLGIAYENRRWRHSAEALGRLRAALARDSAAAVDSVAAPDSARTADPAAATGPRFLAFERRLDLVAAAIAPLEPGAAGGPVRFEVRHPSDPSFPRRPAGPTVRRTLGRPDLELQPLLSYELGRVFQPVLLRIALSPRVRVVPWPGALATAALEIPVRNDFGADALHPDIDQVRPGQMTLDQFAWMPQAALLSASAGFFGDNRWGLSLGAARPLADGALLLDAQADVTGFASFGPDQVEYSTPEFWTGFGGVVWHPPLLDVAVRGRAERYLGGDRGVELEVRRSMGDFDLGLVAFRTGGVNLLGVRLQLPLPPMTRAAGVPVRVQLPDRWPFEHRSTSGGYGETLRGVASREEFLRQLARPTLEANAERYRLARGPRLEVFAEDSLDWVSWSGMTGFVNTPWAGVQGDRRFEAGFDQVPARWAYDQRRRHDNQIYYATFGFLPHVEAALRATAFPGLRSFEEVVPGSQLTDTDEMASGRIEFLPARTGRPGLAVGIEDVQGTRRFHSTYAVVGLPWRFGAVRGRLAAGYAPRILDAQRYTLDGGFGAAEISPLRAAAFQLEYDTEKWNAAVALRLPYGLRARAALLGMTHGSFGGGFHFAL